MRWLLPLIIAVFLITISSVTFAEQVVYDDFSGSVLDLTKWRVETTPSEPFIQPITAYYIDTNEQNYHTEQNMTYNGEVILTMLRTVQPRDAIEYDVNYKSGSGNVLHIFYIDLNKALSFDPFGYWNGDVHAGNQYGIYHVKLKFNNNSIDVTVRRPDNTLWNYTFNPSGLSVPCTVSFSTRTGDNGLVHMDYDNFSISSPSHYPLTTPTALLCDGSPCTNNQSFWGDVGLQCSGSVDPDGNNLTYNIEAFKNDFWNKRRPIDINVSGPQLIDYQVLLNITYSSAMRFDFGDLRFVNSCSPSAMELPYYIQNKEDSQYAEVWVKVDVINTTICMYYGNPTAQSKSDPDATFFFFDDAKSGNISDKWDVAGARNGYAFSYYPDGSRISASMPEEDLYEMVIAKKYGNITNYSMEFLGYPQEYLGVIANWKNKSSHYEVYSLSTGSSAGNFIFKHDGETGGDDGAGRTRLASSFAWIVPKNHWNKMKMTVLGNNITFFSGGMPLVSVEDNTFNEGRMGLFTMTYPPGGSAFWANITVRKFNDPEPTYSIGNETTNEGKEGRIWTLIGNHGEGQTFIWNISGLPCQSGIDLRCRATSVRGVSAYFSPGIDVTLNCGGGGPGPRPVDVAQKIKVKAVHIAQSANQL